jgi:hypothetical protein
MLLSEAFARYGCKLNNVNWSVSAFNTKNELSLVYGNSILTKQIKDL